jgi:maleylpyruvate isomerase
VEPVLARIQAATEGLLRTAASLADADIGEPSLLPGWTRGHVLTHVARNADGGTRLLTWARTGVETLEYASMAARAAEIEAGHRRTAPELLDDMRDSAARFADAYRAMPEEAWARPLRWTSGKQRPATRAADSRLTEVLVHHVDLRAGFTPADWPAGFVRATLADVVAALGGRPETPAMRLVAVDTGATYAIGRSAKLVRGSQTALLAWLLGRSAGADLDGPLPAVPFLY